MDVWIITGPVCLLLNFQLHMNPLAKRSLLQEVWSRVEWRAKWKNVAFTFDKILCDKTKMFWQKCSIYIILLSQSVLVLAILCYKEHFKTSFSSFELAFENKWKLKGFKMYIHWLTRHMLSHFIFLRWRDRDGACMATTGVFQKRAWADSALKTYATQYSASILRLYQDWSGGLSQYMGT